MPLKKRGRKHYISLLAEAGLREAIARAFERTDIEEAMVKSWADDLRTLVNIGMERKKNGDAAAIAFTDRNFLVFDEKDYPDSSLLVPELKKQLSYVNALLGFLRNPSAARDNVALSALPPLQKLHETFSPDATSARDTVLKVSIEELEKLRSWFEVTLARQDAVEEVLAKQAHTRWGILYYRLLKRMCVETGVKPTLGKSPEGRPNGKIFALAKQTQALLPNTLKSRSDTALCSLLLDARAQEKRS